MAGGPDVKLIAAIGRRGQIGLDGSLPWRDPEDLKWFKSMTMDDWVVVGGRTFETLPELPGRLVVGWGRDIDPQALISMLFGLDPTRTIWIAGGARTYKAFLPFVRHSVITHVNFDGDADTFMPRLWSDL